MRIFGEGLQTCGTCVLEAERHGPVPDVERRSRLLEHEPFTFGIVFCVRGHVVTIVSSGVTLFEHTTKVLNLPIRHESRSRLCVWARLAQSCVFEILTGSDVRQVVALAVGLIGSGRGQ